MGCQTPSAADQLPAASAAADEDARTSLRGPEAKLRSMRLSPVARAFRVTAPDSSEPAMRRAVPASVTSATAVPPVSAFKAPCKTGGVCWAAADCCTEPQGENKRMANK